MLMSKSIPISDVLLLMRSSVSIVVRMGPLVIPYPDKIAEEL
jgi:hypothetical protein